MATQRFADTNQLELFFLDMGREKYGDCIVCRLGSETILIDGGHPGDTRDREGHLSIPHQLEQIFGHAPPFDISLLVVTHCHLDHVGCLPSLVADDVIRPEWALVADENLGFGVTADGSDLLADLALPAYIKRVAAALREEDRSDLADDDLERFLADAATLLSKYVGMLEALERRIGDRLVRYGIDSTAALKRRFASFGFTILGPTTDHLLICADTIRRTVSDFIADVEELVADGSFGDTLNFNELAAYRTLARQYGVDGEADRRRDRPGYALNDQSIVIQLQPSSANVLLTGDMQFAEPDIDELRPAMASLRRKIAAQAPFDLVKIGHHGSHNAFDADVLAEMGGTPLYVISGGIEDRSHPDAGVLQLLKRARLGADISWARTDKNGLITVTFGANSAVTKSRGRLNSTQPNIFDASTPLPISATAAAMAAAPAPAPTAVSPVLSATGGGGASSPPSAKTGDVVRVVTEVPHVSTQVTVSIRVEPSSDAPRVGPDHTPSPELVKLGGGRNLPPLLFITSKDALAASIGNAAALQAIDAVRRAGQLLIDSLPAGVTEPSQVLTPVREMLNDPAQVRRLRGVVILGGYDVVPASRLDTIDASLRQMISGAAAGGSTHEWDDFIVWSDAIYGDRDGDGMGELPVSRIPDARSSDFFLRVLQADGGAPLRRAAVRNLKRPFADHVFSGIKYPEYASTLVSAPTAPHSAEFAEKYLQDSAIYLMLHGNYQNPASFAGEDVHGAYTAINVANVGQVQLNKSVVLAGCCWGALTVRERAIDLPHGKSVTPLAPNQSMALSFLNSGALAFCGCTGVHYSPSDGVPSTNGGPLHVSFWKHYGAGHSPAEALFQAKSDYIAGIPHDATADAFERGIELKILREFTCLGLGW